MELVQLIMQLAILEAKVRPVMPQASQKLVKDLLDSGCDARKLAKVVGRSPGWIKGVATGQNCLTAKSFTLLVQHAVRSRKQDANNQ